LDLFAESFPVYEKTRQFSGKPFVWNMLHNFGGNLGMSGNLTTMTERFNAVKAAPNLKGIGLTMEGINQNTLLYDYVLDWQYTVIKEDSIFLQKPIKDNHSLINTYLSNYANYRYNVEDKVGMSETL
jgi:alpha-N-acetylglucosaminidase